MGWNLAAYTKRKAKADNEMDVLIVAATRQEILPLLNHFKAGDAVENFSIHNYRGIDTGILITGVGILATAMALSKISEKEHLLAINAGIAGAFSKNIPVGGVVRVTEDIVADIGVEHMEDFLPLQELKLEPSAMKTSGWTAENTGNYNQFLKHIPTVKGITVNTCSGSETTIQKRMRLFSPCIESMEGAAFFHCCHEKKICCVQLRAISNYIEPRNLNNWNIPLATTNLCRAIAGVLDSISEKATT
jgi:futalosine hydrolase